jgi:uncharacterized protein (TIGR04255 family)
MSEIFPNAPLREAVFQVRFSGELSVEVARARIQDEVRSELPKLYVPRATPGVAPALQPIALHSEDESEIVGIALNSFSYHSKRYAGFSTFHARFRRFWMVFSEHVRLTRLTRVGLRYINHIPVLRPSEAAPIPVEDYINVKFQLPPAVGGDLTHLNTTFEVRMEEGVLRIVIEHKKLEAPPQSEILLLDFDFGQEEGLVVPDVERYLERAHQHTKRIFLDLISDKYLAVMRSTST